MSDSTVVVLERCAEERRRARSCYHSTATSSSEEIGSDVVSVVEVFREGVVAAVSAVVT